MQENEKLVSCGVKDSSTDTDLIEVQNGGVEDDRTEGSDGDWDIIDVTGNPSGNGGEKKRSHNDNRNGSMNHEIISKLLLRRTSIVTVSDSVYKGIEMKY